MRYIKLLILAILIFFAVLFFVQNQEPLSQEMTLTLNLFFVPPFTSIPLPFYFVAIGSFVIGCLLSGLWLFWDKVTSTGRVIRLRSKVKSLKREVESLQKSLERYEQPQNTTKQIPANSEKDSGEDENN